MSGTTWSWPTGMAFSSRLAGSTRSCCFDICLMSGRCGRLRRGDVVLVDAGASVEGYFSDLTRTVVFGEATARQRRIWEVVLRANRAAFEAIRPGTTCEEADGAARRVIEEETTGRVAAVVLEPIQGWAGSVFPPDEFLPRLRALCDEMDILLFADEILTGMGRTGKWFAVEHYGVVPDVMTIGKGLGNGYPVTAMVVREEYKDVLERISASSSYGGNPVACAAALATIEVIEEEGLLENARRIEKVVMKRLGEMKERYEIVGDVRGKGALFGIELVKDEETKEPFEEAGRFVYRRAFEKGLAWIPAGHILRLSPPLIMPEEIALKGLDILEEAIDEAQREVRR